jgi:hypothetical protein
MAHFCQETQLHASVGLNDVHYILSAKGTEEVVDEILNEGVIGDRSAIRWGLHQSMRLMD